MTVHVVSVGRRLIERLQEPARFGQQRAAVSSRRAHMHDVLSAADDPSAASDRLTELFDGNESLDLVDVVAPGLWPPDVSPEIHSIAAHGDSQIPLADDDLAVLIATDTRDGLTAAMWNALALAAEPGRVRYVADTATLIQRPPGGAVVVRIPGLDASTERGFRLAMRHLGQLGGALLLQLPRGEECRFHLSGGFKVTIPYLCALAEAMRSAHPSITAFVLHETTDAPIRLPLRILRQELLDTELTPFDHADEVGVAPGQGILDGYAYEQQATTGPYRLTGFGVGLRALRGYVPRGIEGSTR